MKLVLDTHIFLWFITRDRRMPAVLLPLIRDPANEVFLSVVSVREIMVKHQIGKLASPHPLIPMCLDSASSIRSQVCRSMKRV